MADDTVDRARQDVLDIVAAYGIQNSEKGPFAQYLDALIAAVRAEPRRHAVDCKIHFAEGRGGFPEPCTCGLTPLPRWPGGRASQ